MAEGWTRHLKNDLIDVYSAGIQTHGLNPHAVSVMAEAGVDISGQKSTLVSDYTGQNFDYVITVCSHANETCPFFPGLCKRIHVGFDDPPKMAAAFQNPEEKLNCYRKVRDEIKKFVLSLPESLTE